MARLVVEGELLEGTVRGALLLQQLQSPVAHRDAGRGSAPAALPHERPEHDRQGRKHHDGDGDELGATHDPSPPAPGVSVAASLHVTTRSTTSARTNRIGVPRPWGECTFMCAADS